jgi:hypothetical protein
LAFGDGDDDRLVLALVGKMVLQLHPQHARLGANNVVFGRVIAGLSTVDVNRDLRFSGLFGLVLASAAAHVEEEGSEPR